MKQSKPKLVVAPKILKEVSADTLSQVQGGGNSGGSRSCGNY